MAKAIIAFCSVDRPSYVTRFCSSSQEITLSGSNQLSSACPDYSALPAVAVLTNDGSGFYYAIGPSPDSTITTQREYCPPNAVVFKTITPGDKIGVVL